MQKKMFLTTLLLAIGSNTYADTTYSTLQNANIPNKFLTVNADNSLSLATASGADNQLWAFINAKDGSGFGYFKNKTNPNLCLNAVTNLYQSCTQGGYSTYRKFYLEPLSNNKFRIFNQFKTQINQPAYLASNDNGSGTTYRLNDNTNKLIWVFNGKYDSPFAFFGNRKVLLVNAYFNGQKPQNGTDVYNAFFKNSSNKLNFQEYVELASKGRASISGEFIDQVKLDTSPLTTCTTAEKNEKVFNPIRKLAEEKGIRYEYLYVELPYTKLCNYGAVAIGPKTIHSNGNGHKYWMWSHEAGHNLGFLHTEFISTETVNSSTVRVTKSGGQFGIDYSDALGGGGAALYPLSYRIWLGWLDREEVPFIESKGIYTIQPAYSTQQGYKGLRIARKDGSFLEMEYRPTQGKYDQFADKAITKGLTIRQVKITHPYLTNSIIDTTPNTDSKDSPLTVGRTLIDELSGYSIKVLSVNENTGIIVDIR